MTGAIFHWDAKPYFDQQHQRLWFQHYDYACRAFGVDKLVVIDPTDQLSLDVDKARDLEAAMQFFDKECDPVFIHGSGNQELASFIHPNNAVYIVGPDYGALGVRRGAASVFVPVARPVELWAATALAIVLYDRFLRG